MKLHQNGLEDGLALLDGVVREDAEYAQRAGTICADAAKARVAAGDLPGALTLLRKARGLSPEDLRYNEALGGALEAVGDDSGALAEYRAVIAKTPCAPEIPQFSERIEAVYKRRNDNDARVAEWRSLVKCHPDAAVPQLHLGMALEDSGDNPGAEAAYREAARLRPEWQDPKVRLDAAIAAGGGVEEGLRLMDEAVRDLPDLAGSVANGCSQAATARVAAGDLPGALTLLRRAHSLAPKDLRYRAALGETLEAAGDDDGALTEYRALVSEAPESSETPHSSERIDAVYKRRNDTAGRVAEWRDLAQAHPDASVLQLHLGMALENSGNSAGAEAAYREAIRLRPDWQDPKLRLGAIIAAGGNVEEGLRLLDEAVGIMPDLAGSAAEGCGRAAKVRASAGDAAGALALTKRARSLSPSDLRYREALGEALDAAGDDNGALGEYRAVVADLPESIHSSNRIDAICGQRNDPAARVAEWKGLTQNHPDAAVPQLHLGMALEDSGDSAGAEAAYREALRRRPEGQDPKVRLGAIIAAGGRVEEGLRLMDEAVRAMPGLANLAAEGCGHGAKVRIAGNDLPGAITLLRRARDLSPKDLRHRVALGEALEAAGNEDGALAEYRAVAEEAPESPESQRSSERMDGICQQRGGAAARVAAWKDLVQNHPDAAMLHLYLGMALEDSGDTSGAEAAYREALRLSPEGQNPKLRLGVLVAAKGGVEEGLRMLDEAVRAMPSLAGSAAEGCDRAAKARGSAGDGAGALALAKRARSLSPSDLRYRVALGGALEAAGDDDGALDEYRAVVEQAPESPKSSARMDAILEKRGDKAARVDAWRRMAETHPGAAVPRIHLGMALEASGDKLGAESAYREALSRNALAEVQSDLFRRIRRSEIGQP